MTVCEFIKYIEHNKSIGNDLSDKIMGVHITGVIGGSTVELNNPCTGIDFDHGRLILHPKESLRLTPKRKKK